MSLSAAFINHALGTSEDGHELEYVITKVSFLPLKEKTLSAEEWILHWFDATNLVGRTGSMDSISTEDLMLISTIRQGVKINFDSFMIEKIRSIFDKVIK